jgi:hypothetical protein
MKGMMSVLRDLLYERLGPAQATAVMQALNAWMGAHMKEVWNAGSFKNHCMFKGGLTWRIGQQANKRHQCSARYKPHGGLNHAFK